MSLTRRIWALAWPVILSNLSVPLLGAVDTAMVGRLDRASALGAVAVGALVFDFVYWGFGFLRMGTTGFAAHARGGGQLDESRATLGRAMLLGGILGLGVLAAGDIIAAIAFPLIDTTPAVAAGARAYFDARIWAAPAVLMNYAVLGWLIGVQRPGAALVLQLVMNGTNVALDVLFVQGLHQGEAGVAAASAISQYVALLTAIPLLRAVLAAEGGVWSRALLWDRERLKAMWAANVDLFIRTLCLIGSFAYFTVRGARQGEVVLAANAVLLNLQTFMAYGLDGFAHAAEALVGEALGAGDRDRLAQTVRRIAALGGGLALICTGVYWAFGREIIGLLTDLPAVLATAEQVLPWAVASPIVSVWCFLLDGVFIGAGETRAMRNAMLVSLGGFLALVALAVPTWGNHGLWFALLSFMVLRALTLVAAGWHRLKSV